MMILRINIYITIYYLGRKQEARRFLLLMDYGVDVGFWLGDRRYKKKARAKSQAICSTLYVVFTVVIMLL